MKLIRPRFLTVSLLLGALAGPGGAATMVASNLAELGANGYENSGRTRSLAGATSTTLVIVVSFQLPDLGEVSNPFSTATLTFPADRLIFDDNPRTAVDLYGLSAGTVGNALPYQYYAGAADTTPGTSLLQSAILNDISVSAQTPNGGTVPTLSTSLAGDLALLAYLNAQYADGEGVGKFVYLRFNPESETPVSFSGYDVYNGDSDGRFASVPTITFTAVPEPSGVVMVGIGSVALISFRRRKPVAAASRR